MPGQMAPQRHSSHTLRTPSRHLPDTVLSKSRQTECFISVEVREMIRVGESSHLLQDFKLNWNLVWPKCLVLGRKNMEKFFKWSLLWIIFKGKMKIAHLMPEQSVRQDDRHRSWGDAHLSFGAAQAPPNWNGIDLRLINFDNPPIFKIHK